LATLPATSRDLASSTSFAYPAGSANWWVNERVSSIRQRMDTEKASGTPSPSRMSFSSV
jgi:hypothetical protein